jgi:DNA mismatch repair ATPase MutS
LDKEEKMQNYMMEVLPKAASKDAVTDDFKYTYRLLPGISNVKGGIKVLQDLEYPAEIIANTRNTIKELFV